MTGQRVLYAPNVHQGGGRRLLLPLLEHLRDDASVLFVLDERLAVPDDLVLAGDVLRVVPSVRGRLACERGLRGMIRQDACVLCMGNLPPLFASCRQISVFVQNRYLLDQVATKAFGLATRLRIAAERFWLQKRAGKVSRFIVQTPTMRKRLWLTLAREAEIMPFVPCQEAFASHAESPVYDFLYVASGEPHKNHRRLVEAWALLARQGVYPSLCLTLDKRCHAELYAWIMTRIQRYHLRIELVGNVADQEVASLYGKSRALIYPSLFESFGLPLVEAVSAGLPVLAADRDYVFDVLDHPDVFDPLSPSDIAASVMHFTFQPAGLKVECWSAARFLDQTLYA